MRFCVYVMVLYVVIALCDAYVSLADAFAMMYGRVRANGGTEGKNQKIFKNFLRQMCYCVARVFRSIVVID